MTRFIFPMLPMRNRSAHLPWLIPIILLVVAVPQVSAHTEYVRSDPAADATLPSAPQQVTIIFSALLDIAGSSVTVVDASGTTVSQGATTISPSDQKALVVALQPGLGAGTYRVNWTAQSAEDGHTSTDSFIFTVGAPTQVSSHTVTQLPVTGTSSGSRLLLLVAIALVGAGLSVHVGRFARSRQS